MLATKKRLLLQAVLQIRDILAQIRIYRSVPLSNRSRLGSCYFRWVTFKMITKNNFFSTLSFFAFYFLKLHLHHFSMIKSHKDVTKQYKSRLFFIFCLSMEGSGCGAGSGSRRPENIRIIWIRNTGFDHACNDLIPGDELLCPACRAWVQTILPPQLANGKQLYYPAVTK